MPYRKGFGGETGKHLILRLWVYGCLAGGAFVGRGLKAQETAVDTTVQPESVFQAHLIHVAPHRILFDSTMLQTTLRFQNTGSATETADILVEDAYLSWSHGLPLDTTLFTEHEATVEPHDTVILTPGPHEHYAGAWLIGLPTHMTLKPHETRRVTIRIAPPPHLPDGDYWARIVVLTRPEDRQHASGRDTRIAHALPIQGVAPSPLRDTVRIFYRQGHVTMGIAAAGPGLARQDVNNQYQRFGDWDRALWIRLPLRLTGNTHFEGIVHVTTRNVATGEEHALDPWAITLYHAGVLHGWASTDNLSPGHYQLIITFTSPQEDVPLTQRIPLTAAPIRIPFDVEDPNAPETK